MGHPVRQAKLATSPCPLFVMVRQCTVQTDIGLDRIHEVGHEVGLDPHSQNSKRPPP